MQPESIKAENNKMSADTTDDFFISCSFGKLAGAPNQWRYGQVPGHLHYMPFASFPEQH
jgi:hypothetical protein